MEDISKYEVCKLTIGSLYSVDRKELRKLGASQFAPGDIIRVGKYYIHIKYGNFDTPALETWVEDENFKPINCTPGSSKGFTPYYIADFKNR